MNNYGYIKVAAATPSVRVADCEYNSERIVAMMQQAADKGVKAVHYGQHVSGSIPAAHADSLRRADAYADCRGECRFSAGGHRRSAFGYK